MGTEQRAINGYTHVKVFSTTMHKERAAMGDAINDWMSTMRTGVYEIVDTTVVQSSDNEFHCLTIVVFYRRV